MATHTCIEHPRGKRNIFKRIGKLLSVGLQQVVLQQVVLIQTDVLFPRIPNNPMTISKFPHIKLKHTITIYYTYNNTITKQNLTIEMSGRCTVGTIKCEIRNGKWQLKSKTPLNVDSSISILVRTTPLRKIEKMIDFYIFGKSTGLEKFTGANCDQIGPLVEILSSFKIGAPQKNRLSIWHYIGAVSRWCCVVNKNAE